MLLSYSIQETKPSSQVFTMFIAACGELILSCFFHSLLMRVQMNSKTGVLSLNLVYLTGACKNWKVFNESSLYPWIPVRIFMKIKMSVFPYSSLMKRKCETGRRTLVNCQRGERNLRVFPLPVERQKQVHVICRLNHCWILAGWVQIWPLSRPTVFLYVVLAIFCPEIMM